jgi:hypothetical protein
MRRVVYIFILTLIYLMCSSKGCTDDGNLNEIREDKIIVASKDSILHAFEFDTPGYKLLRAYEATAIQKLTDFADYLKISSDSSLNKTFRIQASEMAGRLFISLDADTHNWNKIHPEPEPKPLTELLKKSLLNKNIGWIRPAQIKIETPLTLKNDSTCSGTLSFYQQYIPFDSAKPLETGSGMCIIDIYALKKLKSFGKESLTIWEVYLGNIR